MFDRNQNSRLRLALTGLGDFLGSRVRDEAKSKYEEDEQEEEEWMKATRQSHPKFLNLDDGTHPEPRLGDNRR